MNSALVIGSSSTLGRAVGEDLGGDYNVSYAGRSESDFPLDLTCVNLSGYDGLLFDVVVHTASDFGGASGESIRQAELTNAIGTLDICRLARKVKARHLIIISSISATYLSHHPLYNIYALSKRHGEELASLYSKEQGLAMTILRPTQLYDARGLCRKHQPFLYSIIDKARAGVDVEFYGSNDARRNLLFLDDLTMIIRKVIGAKVTGEFDCAFPQSIRLSEIAKTAYTVFDQAGSIRFQPDKPDIPDLPETSDFSLYDLIEYLPQTNFAQGLGLLKDRCD